MGFSERKLEKRGYVEVCANRFVCLFTVGFLTGVFVCRVEESRRSGHSPCCFSSRTVLLFCKYVIQTSWYILQFSSAQTTLCFFYKTKQTGRWYISTSLVTGNYPSSSQWSGSACKAILATGVNVAVLTGFGGLI